MSIIIIETNKKCNLQSVPLNYLRFVKKCIAVFSCVSDTVFYINGARKIQ